MDRIVVGVDGSKGAELALRWALREAQVHTAILEVVAVHPYPDSVGVPGARFPVEKTEDAETRAREELDRFVRRVAGEAPAVEVVRVVFMGNPAEKLLTAAKQADMLVVGSRGLGGFRGLVLGSVSQQCVTHATCATVIVPTPADH